MKYRVLKSLTVIFLFILTPVSGWAVVYVDAANNKGPWDGRSWATSYNDIQEAISSGDKEIWIAKGTYKPTTTSNREISFQLKTGVSLYGGFKGTERKRSERDWKSNITILSGDIGVKGEKGDNSYHVIKGAGLVTVDGLTITGGNADDYTYNAKGGGMVNYVQSRQSRPGAASGFSPKVINCTFVKNSAIEGGAMYNYGSSKPKIINCIFAENYAENGGAILDRVGVKSNISGCEFVKNFAKWRGGALYFDYGSRPNITNCTFSENATDAHGGAVYMLSRASQLEHTIPSFSGCTFTGNRAEWRGGAVSNADNCKLYLKDCTFIGNYAGKGGGALANDYHTSSTVTNCVFQGNSAGEGEADIDTDSSSFVKVK